MSKIVNNLMSIFTIIIKFQKNAKNEVLKYWDYRASNVYIKIIRPFWAGISERNQNENIGLKVHSND